MTTPSIRLLDCPCCAGRAKSVTRPGEWAEVWCEECDLKIRTFNTNERFALIDVATKWNRRAYQLNQEQTVITGLPE